jgi:trimethylamine---corrinoid protein Co-methyltransferase
MTAALAGANMIYGLGMVELGMTMDFGLLVADNEFVRMIRRMLDGVPVNDEALAVDVIREVGIGGEFVTHQHTFDNFKTNQSQSALVDRNTRGVWKDAGGKDMHTRCNEFAREVLKTHQPQPLPSGVAQTLRDIVTEAEKEFTKA